MLGTLRICLIGLTSLLVMHSPLRATSRLAETNAASKNDRLTNQPAGVISFDKPLVDFGLVKRGHKLPAKFTFRNIGKGPLAIQGVQASCNCTTIESAKGKTFASGETGFIEVVFDTTDYSGKITKAITVVTNERSMPHRTLTITATVNSEIDAQPPLADFGEVVLNQTPTQKIKLKSNMKSPLKIERIRFNEEFLDVSYTKEGNEFSISVKLKSTLPIGFYKDTIWVKNNSSALPEMPVPVRATVRGQISATPNYLEFGSVSSNAASSRELRLSSSGQFKIIDNSVELNINGAKAEDGQKLIKIDVQKSEGPNQNISLELKNPGNRSGSVHGKVTLQTDNPQQKNLVVDFYAFFR